ncbi:pirin family protein [Pedobacter sp. SYSU D00535]|uniref:pirin family protein n=1 Tax=Pedobacter sp. SYSU D00535 TaxID=2810308 RepID=UPI001A958EC4|nr:pirin family protein [Pedobacter sp. SYSU D00535]
MRTVKAIHNASFSPIGELITYTALPNRSIDQVDPFLFLNHHGHQVYPPNNNGLPFGPHPHRGMETVTFILEGDIMHQDTGGHQSVITAGGVQWMTAGRGLIHAEVSSDEFKKQGGGLEILQLWLNLPARLKMTEPFYKGLQSGDIPKLTLDDGKVTLNLVSGNLEGVQGAFESHLDLHLSTIFFNRGGSIHLTVPENHNIFFYVIRGELRVNEALASIHQLVEFGAGSGNLQIDAIDDSILLFGHAEPLNEPLVAQGPFVMNTHEEIRQAYDDYRQGKFGNWSF